MGNSNSSHILTQCEESLADLNMILRDTDSDDFIVKGVIPMEDYKMKYLTERNRRIMADRFYHIFMWVSIILAIGIILK